MATTVARTLDVKGQSCPVPIVKTAQAMKQLGPGELVEVLATDPGSVKDFAAWSKTTGHQLVETSQQDGVFRFVLRKKG
ncbi:MAG TPA: sulfurtransferase TusA family protein [Candidatus Limnocylindria bacterium]|nr:sulfurtransferase TusA family protein [Candidatus Limnocylindria bacterium]